jgi:NADH-quinone oxidoreductase subunit M
MVILASVPGRSVVAALAAFTLIIGAAYTLWLVKRVIFGEVANDHVAHLKDINSARTLMLGAFAAACCCSAYGRPADALMDASISRSSTTCSWSRRRRMNTPCHSTSTMSS